MKRFLLNSACAAFVGLLCLSTQAKADIAVKINDSVRADFGGYTPGTGQIHLTVDGVNTVTTANGGLMHYTNTKVNNVAATPQSDFYSMCVDLSQYIAWTGNTFTARPTAEAPKPYTYLPSTQDALGMGEKAANALGWLWHSTQGYGPALQADNEKGLFQRVIQQTLNTTTAIATKKLVAGALQLATWKLVYDGKTSNAFDLAHGNLRITLINGTTGQAEYDLAQMFLNAISDKINTGGGIQGWSVGVMALLSDGQQDQLVSAGIPTPEPATIAIWGLVGSLGAVCGVRFNRRRLRLATAQEILA